MAELGWHGLCSLNVSEGEDEFMKAQAALLMILLTAQAGFAKYSCTADGEKLVVDPSNKSITLTKDGKPHHLRILNPANHGFEMFGRTKQAFEIEGGYVVGIKDEKNSNRKELSVFKRGEVIANFNDCTEK
jgi:hypothetical protein